MGFTISFAGAKDFTPYEGGGDLYPFEGQTFGTIIKLEEGLSKEKGNQMLIFTIACDEPEAKGMKVKKWVPVTGMRSDNKPNVIGLLEGLASVYSETMSNDEAVAKARGLDGTNLDSAQVVAGLTGKKVYYEVRARSFQRDDGSTGWSSECSNFTLRGKYLDLKSVNSHHKPLPPDVGQQVQTQGQGQSGGGTQQQSTGGQQQNQQNGQTGGQAGSSAAKTNALGIL